MQIQVLGSGCEKCKKLFELTKQAAKEMGLEAKVEYITDVSKIIEMGVMSSPVLAINGQPVLTGGGHENEDIKNAVEKLIKKDNSLFQILGTIKGSFLFLFLSLTK